MGKRAVTRQQSRSLADVKTPAKVIGFYSDKKGKQYREFSNFFRQRHSFDFQIPPFARRDGFPQSIACAFTEKAIMATKASLMGDLEAFCKIDRAANPTSCNHLGRGVQNFDDELWNMHVEEIAFEVVRQKFQSDRLLREVLLSTGESILAEAAPNDSIWGVGLPLSDERLSDPSCWRGRNVLGFALMRVREHLRGDVLTAVAPSAIAGIKRSEDEEKSLGTEQQAEVASVDVDCDTVAYAARDAAKAAAPIETESISLAEVIRYNRRWPRRWKVESSSAAQISMQDALLPSAWAAAEAAAGLDDQCFAVLDFEATCDDGRRVVPQEVIEFPIVLVDSSTGENISEFRTYVQPVFHPQLTTFCTNLTGIQQCDVDAAPQWKDALAQVQLWLDAEMERRGIATCIFVTCGDWDLNVMISRQCEVACCHVPQRFRQWMNIKDLFSSVLGKKGQAMPAMLQALNLELKGHHHSGLDDCRNIARILQVLLQKGGSKHVEALIKSSVPSGRASTSNAKGHRCP